MAALSDALENALLNHVLRATAYVGPTAVYLALFTADPTDANTTAGEVSGGSYGRKQITFGAPSGGSCSNTNQMDYTGMPAATVTHLAIYDASTAGTLLFHGALSASKTVNAGDTFTVNAGGLTCSLA